jgi:hypothetical protein
MRPDKNYYKLTDDAPTAEDKKREAGLAAELEKKAKSEKPVVKKTVIVKKLVIKPKQEKPLSKEERESGMEEALNAEDFYGEKKAADFMKKKVSDAVRDAQSEKIIEEMKKRGFGKGGKLVTGLNKKRS